MDGAKHQTKRPHKRLIVVSVTIFVLLIAGALLLSNSLRTLASLRQVDGHPLYTMTYYGGYDVLPEIAEAYQAVAASEASEASASWACSLFTAFGEEGQAVYGRNFDWRYSPALLLFTDPPDGYASVAMVDIEYLGFGRGDVASLPSWQDRIKLLRAPLLPFDGMNEHGLTIGMAAVPQESNPGDPDKTTIGSLMVIRLLLDHARDTEEAVALLQEYNIDFTGGPPLHYLIADPSGHSAVIELINGETHVLQNNEPWQVATNFCLTNATEATKKQCDRYTAISAHLQKAQGSISSTEAMTLLAEVAQPSTQWSAVYNMSTREVDIAMLHQYEQIHKFQLPGQKYIE